MARPGILVVTAAALFVAAFIAAVMGTSLAFPGTVLDRLWDLNPHAHSGFQTLGRTSGALLWATGTIACSAGVGLLRRRRWAWWLSIALLAMTAGGDVFNIVIRRNWMRSGVGVCVSAAFLLALVQPAVKRFLNGAPNAGPPADQEDLS